MICHCKKPVVMLSCSKRVTHFETAWPCNSEMKSACRTPRVNLSEIKLNLCQVLGPEREKRYFKLLSDFLNSKLTKPELDESIPSIIGTENVWLHNKFILSIFSNACSSDPPPVSVSQFFSSKRHKSQNHSSLGPPSSAALSPFNNDEKLNVHKTLNSRSENTNGLSSLTPSTKRIRSSTSNDRSIENAKRRKVKEESFLNKADTTKIDADSKFQPSPQLRSIHTAEVAVRSDCSLYSGNQTRYSAHLNGFTQDVDSSFAGESTRFAVSDRESDEEAESTIDFGDWSFLKPTAEDSSMNLGLTEPSMHTRCINLDGRLRKKLCIATDPKEESFHSGTLRELKKIKEWESRPIKPPLGASFTPYQELSAQFRPKSTLKQSPPAGLGAAGFLEEKPSEHCATSRKIHDRDSLHNRMQQIACTEYALEDVSADAVFVMEAGLQAYLKQVIKSCVDVVKVKRRKNGIIWKARDDGLTKSSSIQSPSLPIRSPSTVKGLWPNNVDVSLMEETSIEGRTRRLKRERGDPYANNEDGVRANTKHCSGDADGHDHDTDRAFFSAAASIPYGGSAGVSAVGTDYANDGGDDSDDSNDDGKIMIRDLMIAMEKNPNLLGANGEYQLERISMLL